MPPSPISRILRMMALLAPVMLLVLPAGAQHRSRHLISECMACHGEDGIAKDKDVPHLAGQNVDYLVKQMQDFRKGRRPHREMRVMSRTMSENDIRDIADYYASLPR